MQKACQHTDNIRTVFWFNMTGIACRLCGQWWQYVRRCCQAACGKWMASRLGICHFTFGSEMLFSRKSLSARRGDCLILEWG